MMDSTSINRLQRRQPCQNRGAHKPTPGHRGTGRAGIAGLGLCAALAFLAPGLTARAPDARLVALPELTLRAAYGQDFAAAGQHFSSAQDAFAQGKYEQAAKEFQAAFDITHDASMLVNIGESWQRAGDGKKALVGYRAYLAAQPQAPDKSEIEGRIQALEAALAEAASGTTPAGTAGATTSPPPASSPGTPPRNEKPAIEKPVDAMQGGANPAQTPGAEKPIPAATEPGKSDAAKADAAKADAAKADASKAGVTPPTGPSTGLRTAAWVSVAVAVALATSGAIVGLGAQDRADELRRRTTVLVGNQPPVYDAGQAEAYTSLQSEGRTYNQASIALLSVAGAVAVTAGILFIADYVRRPKPETRSKGSWALLPALLPGTTGAAKAPVAGLIASGSF